MNEKLDPNWIVGFTEGEGSFTISLPRSIVTRYKYGIAVRPIFQISQDDEEIIERIHQFFGFGRVKPHAGRKQHKIFFVDKLEDLFKIKKFFEEHPLQSKKKFDFLKWCTVLDMIKSGEHRAIEGIYKIAKIRDSMNTKRKGKSNPGYMNAEEILEFLLMHEASNYRRWSQQETDTVLKFYGKKPVELIAKQIKRTPKCVYHKAIELGLAQKRKDWGSSEVDFLKENYLSMTDSELALQLKRSIASIVKKRVRLGLMKYADKRFVKRYTRKPKN